MVGGIEQASAKDRVNMLVESFGSKKKQKVMASRAANVVNINKVVGAGNAMMESVVGQKGTISEANREMMLDGSKVVSFMMLCVSLMTECRQSHTKTCYLHLLTG